MWKRNPLIFCDADIFFADMANTDRRREKHKEEYQNFR